MDVLPSERKTSFLNKKKQSVDLIGADFLYWKVLKKNVSWSIPGLCYFRVILVFNKLTPNEFTGEIPDPAPGASVVRTAPLPPQEREGDTVSPSCPVVRHQRDEAPGLRLGMFPQWSSQWEIPEVPVFPHPERCTKARHSRLSLSGE